MTNLAYSCKGCGLQIADDEQAVLLVKEVPDYGTSIDPVGSHPDRKIAHKGHEAIWTGLGYRIAQEGLLRELVP